MKKIYTVCFAFAMMLSTITIFGQVAANKSNYYKNCFSEPDSDFDCDWDITPDFFDFKNGEINIHGQVLGYNSTDNDDSYVHPLKRASVSIRSVDANFDDIWIDETDNSGEISIPDWRDYIDIPSDSDGNPFNIDSEDLEDMLSDLIHINFSSTCNKQSISTSYDDDCSLFEEMHIKMSPCSEINSFINCSWNKKIFLWRYAFTDENGEYNFDFLQPGTYEITASKIGYKPSTKRVIVAEGSTEVNFILNATEISYIFDDILCENYSIENISKYFKERMSIDDAIINGYVGCKIIVNTSIGNSFFIYSDGLTIKATNITENKISINISGDDTLSGKTIIIDVQGELFYDIENLIMEYDGEEIREADNLTDVLNPNDDGSHPEYWVIHDANGTHIIISIPHFSQHRITVSSLAAALIPAAATKSDIITIIAVYAFVCAVAAILFVGIINLRKRAR